MTSVHLLHAGYARDRVGSSVVLVRDGDALIVADPGMVANRSLILDPLAAHGVAPERRDPRLPEPPPPGSHGQHRAVPERRGRRLLGALQGRPVARPRRRRLPARAELDPLADARPHGRGRLAHRASRRRGLRDDPPVVEGRPDARRSTRSATTRRPSKPAGRASWPRSTSSSPGHGPAFTVRD